MIDEAHLLYHEATEAFSDRVDAQSLDQLLGDLRGRHRQRPLPHRLRAAARRLPPDEARWVVATADACERAAEEAPALSRALGEGIAALAAAAARAAEDDGGPGGRQTDEYTTTVWLTAGLRDLPAHDAFLTRASLLAESLAKLATAAAAGAEALPDDHREHAALVALADDAGGGGGTARRRARGRRPGVRGVGRSSRARRGACRARHAGRSPARRSPPRTASARCCAGQAAQDAHRAPCSRAPRSLSQARSPTSAT